jgi:hypothetical protein
LVGFLFAPFNCFIPRTQISKSTNLRQVSEQASTSRHATVYFTDKQMDQLEQEHWFENRRMTPEYIPSLLQDGNLAIDGKYRGVAFASASLPHQIFDLAIKCWGVYCNTGRIRTDQILLNLGVRHQKETNWGPRCLARPRTGATRRKGMVSAN